MKWFLALVVLWVLTEVWTRWARKRNAHELLANTRALYSGAHDYREVSLDRYAHVDPAFYAERTEVLRANGFELLGDVEDVTSSLAGPIRPTPIRVMLGDQGIVMAGFYHAIVGGKTGLLLALFGKRTHRIVDLESAFDDGRYIVTSGAQAASGLDQPPEIDTEYFPPGTAIETLLARHRQRVAIRAAEQAPPLRLANLGEVLLQQERLDEIKSEFRNARGGRLSAEEMTRVSGRAFRSTSEELEEEMTKLQ